MLAYSGNAEIAAANGICKVYVGVHFVSGAKLISH